MTALDTSRYFADPRIAGFVEDVQRGDVAHVKQALLDGVDPNAEGIHGFRPIHFVFLAKDAGVLKILLAAGADPNARLANGNRPLHFAVGRPNPDFTRALLVAGADPNEKGENNKPPIHEAPSSHQRENISLLVKAGADMDAIWGGGSPLMASLVTALWEIAATLLDLGARTDIKNHSGKTAVDFFCQMVARVPVTDQHREGVTQVAGAFRRRGVHIPCEATVERFRRPPL